MSPEYVRCEMLSNGVVRLTLSRSEKRNALTRQFVEELASSVEEIRADKTVRLVLLEADGPVFCAGMDLKEMQQRAGSADAQQEWQKDSDSYCELLKSLFTLPVPTIAVLQGSVFAGGIGLVLACDFIIAADDVLFALPEPKRGITAAIVTPFLIHRLGAGVANSFLLSGESLSAKRAAEYGLCYRVVPGDSLGECRDQLVESILTGAPSALATTKQYVQQVANSNESFNEQLENAKAISSIARSGDDAREGLTAFLEKRQPNWFPKTDDGNV